MDGEPLLQCYNRGCGQKFRPEENNESSCQHHPGEPFFHDAFKGWSCCNKKCTDFTEFLNIKGCTISTHSNLKPPEPKKPEKCDFPEEVIEVKPIVKTSIERPRFDTPMTVIKPDVAPSLKVTVKSYANPVDKPGNKSTDEVEVGTLCKNSGCKVSFDGPETNDIPCIYHPGTPIFHEGLKFWSCCQKRTSDFNAFLSQIGCENGKHLWTKQDENSESVQCRWDYHQTGTHVIVSIYAKQYCPDTSMIKLNPVRLFAKIVFPHQDNASFNMDMELIGVIDVGESQVSMYGTKIEIKLKKAEPGSWAKLEIAHGVVPKEQNMENTIHLVEETLERQVETVDLSDL